MSKAGFKTEVANLLTSTTEFTGPDKTKLGTRYIALYEARWNQFLIDNTLTDTPATRTKFVADVLVEGMNEIYKAGHAEEYKDAAPPLETLP